jgi:predicted transcriptional regulator of viral defense system
MRLAGLLHRAARLCRGCVPWSSRGAAAPQLCGGRVPIIQALKAAGGSGSRRSAVCRFSARSLCAGAVRRGRVVRKKKTAYLTAKTPKIVRLARRARAPAAPDRGAPAARTEMCFSL